MTPAPGAPGVVTFSDHARIKTAATTPRLEQTRIHKHEARNQHMNVRTDPIPADADRDTLIAQLRERARFLRVNGLALNSRTLHAGAALSASDIYAVLFYHVLRIDPKNPKWPDRDIFINSRGHSCEPIYIAMADLGFFPWEDLKTCEDFGNHLHGLTATTTPGIELSSGSLGNGISAATGFALGLRVQKRPGRVFVVTGDGELQEGLCWEGALAAAHYDVDNLVVIVDRNQYQSNDRGTETVMSIEPLVDKFEAFGFAVKRIDGHDIGQLVDALDNVPLVKGKPTCIIANTIKGKGVSFLESGHVHCGRFGRDYDPELLVEAISELQEAP
jgi:transketolase